RHFPRRRDGQRRTALQRITLTLIFIQQLLLLLLNCTAVTRRQRKRKLTAVCSHQTRIGNLDAHLI
ncbi:hypothetical protein DEO16_28345, partial [Escherichia coli]